MNRLLSNICVSEIERSTKFYTDLFDFKVNYESDWFVHLVSGEKNNLELGLVRSDHEIVPEIIRGTPKGIYLTVVVDDVNTILQKAQNFDYEILKEPEATFYGQNRMLLKDPSGCIVDVSSPIKA